MAKAGFNERFFGRKESGIAQRTLNHIADNLDEWDQATYSRCFAGHTLLLNGYTERKDDSGKEWFVDSDGKPVRNIAMEAQWFLGFQPSEAKYVFGFYPHEEGIHDKAGAFAELGRRVNHVLERSPVFNEDGTRWNFGPVFH